MLEDVWDRIREAPSTVDALTAVADDAELARHSAFCALAEAHGPGWNQWPAAVPTPRLRGRGVVRRGVRRPDPVLAVGAGDHGDPAAPGRPGRARRSWPTSRSDSIPTGPTRGRTRTCSPSDAGSAPHPTTWARSARTGAFRPTSPGSCATPAYGPWRETLRRTLRCAGALRIDHVMGLFRLYWIPPEGEARDGGYVYWPGTELLDIAVMEAVRAGAVLVGEDLGTVEPEVRTALAEREVHGYRIGWFEDDPPEDWPGTTLASLTTHDLPTVRGVWTGSDAERRADAGQPVEPHEDHLLRSRLARLAGVETDEDLTSREVSLAAHRRLARSGSDLVVATLDDALDVAGAPEPAGHDRRVPQLAPGASGIARRARRLWVPPTSRSSWARTAGRAGGDGSRPTAGRARRAPTPRRGR